MRPFYYVRTIEKILIGLIDMFNNMYVNKYDDMNRTTYSRSVKIPIITHNNANFTNFWSSTQYKQQKFSVGRLTDGFVTYSLHRTHSTSSCSFRRTTFPTSSR